MPYELHEIKKIRKTLGLTQNDLAKRANVSQSLIAKIESENIDPTYTKTKKIFQALNDMERKEELKARDVMNRRIISITSYEDIKHSVRKMKKFNISQMPVIDDHKAVGFLSDSILVDALMQEKDKKVADIMEETPPVVSKTASIRIISNLLHHYPMVLVAESGKLVGLITKADLLGKLYRG